MKIRGFRVEPGEVAGALAALPGVGQAVVVVHDERLVAYLERTGPDDLEIGEIRRLLAVTLPEYLLPAQVVWLDRLPLLSHGKVDRRALPDPVLERPENSDGASPPEGPVQCAIAEVWAQVLRLPGVGTDDDFFDLGGHSLLATQVVSRLRRALPAGTRPITVMDLFKHPTVRRLAEHAERAASTSGELLYELTPSVDPALHTLSLVCVPYGGATAIVYQPLADALPSGQSLYAVAPPGRDLATTEADRSIEDVAAACVAEILDRVPGPLVVYGHCGPGGALAVEIARRLEAAGRRLEAVYLGGVFPFARPTGALGRLARTLRMERLRSDTVYANWLQSMGADVGALDPAERRQLIGAMRRDAQFAEDYFTRLLDQGGTPLNAPVVSVVGERDPGTEYYQERFREWDFLTRSTGLVVVDEAGHYFLKYRAPELAEIVTGIHHRLAAGTADDLDLDPASQPAAVGPAAVGSAASSPAASGPAAVPGAAGRTGNWRLVDVHAGVGRPEPSGPRPSMARFLTVALSQLVANTGAALTMFAIPLWIYVQSESLLRFALFSVVATLPGILAGPVAGALVDRSDRRRVLVAATVAASLVQGSLALLVWVGTVPAGLLYGLLALLSVAVTVQRLAYLSAVPQLVPKRYLGNANGVVQLASGAANFLVPLLAVGLLAAIELAGILAVEVLGYAVALAVLAVTRFPATMAWRRRETVVEEITGGFWYFWNRNGLRAMLMFFVVINMFLAMVVVLLSPLVLTVGTLTDAGRVATIATVGALAGGLLVAVWGGPRRYRMRGMLISTAGYGASALVVALRPDLTVIAAGALGMSFFLVVQNGIWMTIIHTKVPQRFHARVIALNQMAAQSVVAVGFLAAPTLSGVLEPLLLPGGALTDSLGVVVGVGSGRGIALVYVVCGVVMTVVALGALRRTRLATFDLTVPDAEPDDLVGIAALAGRGGADAPVAVRPAPARSAFHQREDTPAE
ncbi:MFS transporter [Plantactinospora alkalitolerans]